MLVHAAGLEPPAGAGWQRGDRFTAPLPHPDDILIDPRDGKVKFAGPMSTEEKAHLDGVLNLMKLLQF